MWMFANTIAHGPCGPLGYSVLAAKEKFHQFCKTDAIIANIGGSRIAYGPDDTLDLEFASERYESALDLTKT